MGANDTFLQFTMLMELIDEVASSRRTESITLRGPTGQTVGVLTVENGLVRFGVEYLGQVYVDAAINLQAPELASLIRKYHARIPITEEDRSLASETQIPRQLLCRITAQALRQLAGKVQLAGGRKSVSVIGSPQAKLLHLGFTPSELIFAAGSSGALRQEDVAVQLYTTPPADTDERWLFEWPPDDLDGLWPVAVTRAATRSVADIATMTALVQQLSALMAERRRIGDRLAIRTQMTRFQDSICYKLASFRYLMVLFLRESQLSSIVVSLQSFVRTAALRSQEKTGSAHQLPPVPPMGAVASAPTAPPSTLPAAAFSSGSSASPSLPLSKGGPRAPPRPLPPAPTVAPSATTRSAAAGPAAPVNKESSGSFKKLAGVASAASGAKVPMTRTTAPLPARVPPRIPSPPGPKTVQPSAPVETRLAPEPIAELEPLSATEWLEAASSLAKDAPGPETVLGGAAGSKYTPRQLPRIPPSAISEASAPNTAQQDAAVSAPEPAIEPVTDPDAPLPDALVTPLSGLVPARVQAEATAVSTAAVEELDANVPAAASGTSESALSSAPSIFWPTRVGEAEPVLRLRDFSVQFGALSICSGVDLELPASGLFLIGAEDAWEKRLLVQALCGPRPSSLRLTGQATYEEGALVDDRAPASLLAGHQLVQTTVADSFLGDAGLREHIRRSEPLTQAFRALVRAAPLTTRELLDPETIDIDEALHSQFLTDLEPGLRRFFELLQATAKSPRALILDEPLQNLVEPQRALILGLLMRQAEERAVLIFTQDLEVYAPSARGTAWFCDGRLQATPKALPIPRGDELQPADPPAPSARVGAFHWLRRGQLAGMPAPGVLNPIEHDLALITDSGVTILVTLTMEPPLLAALQLSKLTTWHFPIEDGSAPELLATAKLCEQVAQQVSQGRAVGYYCTTGRGRTGVMLAAQLIFEGCTAQDALDRLHAVDAGWVDSVAQRSFLARFEEWLASQRAA